MGRRSHPTTWCSCVAYNLNNDTQSQSKKISFFTKQEVIGVDPQAYPITFTDTETKR